MRKLLLILTTLVIGGFAQALLRMESRLPSLSRASGSGGSRSGGSPAGEAATGDAAPEAQCAAITGSGSRCTRPAQEGSAYCWQHEE